MHVESLSNPRTETNEVLASVSIKNLRETFPALHLVRTTRLIRILGKLTFALLVLSVLAMFFAPWQQTSKGYGVVVAADPQFRTQDVDSQYDGIIKYVKAGLREGATVDEGELLFELEPVAAREQEQLAAQIEQTRSARLASINSLEFAKQNVQLQKLSGNTLVEAARSDVEAARNKWKQSEQEVLSLEAEYKQKAYLQEQAEVLFPKGLTSEQDLMDKRNGLTAAFAKLEKARRAVDESFQLLDAKESELEAKRNDLDIKNRESQTKEQQESAKLTEIENKLTDLQIKVSLLDRLKVTAPRHGIVHKLHGREGSNSVKKGDLLFSIVPSTDDLAVELTVPGRDMPLVHLGDKVRLQFQGWPAVQFVGWPSAAVGTFGGRVIALSPTDDMKGNFSILVGPDPEEPQWPDDRYLRQGVRANGWVLLKQVSLGYEIWRQLNGFPPVISDQEPDKAGFGKDKTKIKLPK
jgi:multidrug resistance efflux pump